MKLTLVLVKIIFLGLAVATPSGSPRFKEWKDRRCLQYRDTEYKRNDWDHGNGHKYKHSRTIHVKSGKSIQHAINSASHGDRIVVAAGTYPEQLTIDKDGIQLIGHNAILVPPAKPVHNSCSGLSGPNTQAGICVTGSGVKLAPFVVEHRLFLSAKKLVQDVLVTGIQVRKFSGLNIAVLAARNARVTKNTLTDGAQYGALTLGSVNTLFEGNVVTSTKLGFSIGICMDNQAGVFVSKNHISNQFFALCVQTAGADVQYNEVTASCFGVFVDPGVKGAKIRHNRIGPTNPMCAPFGAVSGITVDGAIKTKVLDNLVEGQKNGGKGAGISLIDDPCVGNESIVCLALGHKAIASGNAILRNTLRNNDLDIYVNTTGRGNLIACNKCSTPEKFCKF